MSMFLWATKMGKICLKKSWATEPIVNSRFYEKSMGYDWAINGPPTGHGFIEFPERLSDKFGLSVKDDGFFDFEKSRKMRICEQKTYGWCGWRGSNPRPLASEANTLSTELQPQL